MGQHVEISQAASAVSIGYAEPELLPFRFMCVCVVKDFERVE